MDDYPAELRNAPPDSLGDDRGYQNRECTSAAAWWAHLAGHELHDYGNASNWPAAAAGRAGYVVDSQPAVGAIAVFRPGIAGAGPYGHVAYVVAVDHGWVTVEDYNYAGSHVYALHTLAPAGLLFIHLPPSRLDGMGASLVTPEGVQARFYIDDAGHIHESWWDGKWNGPVDVTVAHFGTTAPAAGGLSASYDLVQKAQVLFWTGRDGRQYEAWWNGQWNGPVPLPLS